MTYSGTMGRVFLAGLLLLAAACCLWPMETGAQQTLPEYLPDLSALAPSMDDKVAPPPKSMQTEGQMAKVDPGKPLTLAELINLGLTYNPSTRESWATAKAYGEALGQSIAPYYPNLTLTYQASRDREGEKFWGKDDAYTTTLNPQLELTYLLLDLGGRSAGVDEARQSLDSYNLTYYQDISDLMLSIMEAYYSYWASKLSIVSARADVQAAQASLDAAKAQLEAGTATRSDVLQAQATLAQYDYQLATAIGNSSTAWVTLAQATSLPVQPQLKVADPGPVDSKLAAQEVGKLLDQAMKNRQDIKALEASVKSKKAAVDVASSKMWPYLSADVTVADDEENDVHDYTSTATLGLTFDIFTGFGQSYDKRQAVAELWAERGKLAAQRLTVATTVVEQYQAYKTAVSQVRYGEVYVTQAEESYNMQIAKYKAGAGTIVEVVQAQDKLSQARLTLVQAKNNVYQSLSKLAHAVGPLGMPGGENR